LINRIKSMEIEETTPAEIDFDPRKKVVVVEEDDETATDAPAIDPEFFEGDDAEDEDEETLDVDEVDPFKDKWEE